MIYKVFVIMFKGVSMNQISQSFWKMRVEVLKYFVATKF